MTTNSKKQLAQKIEGIKAQIAELEQQLDEIDYVEYGAYDVGTVVKIKDWGLVGYVKEIDFWDFDTKKFVYKINALKKDGTPGGSRVLCHCVAHEDLEVMEDDKN